MTVVINLLLKNLLIWWYKKDLTIREKFDIMNKKRGGTMKDIYEVLRPASDVKSLFNDLKANCDRLEFIENEKKNADTQERFDYLHEKEFILLIENSRLYKELCDAIEDAEVTNENVFELRRTRQLADSLCHTGYIKIN